MRKERIAYYDNAKFFLITAVVLSHYAKLGAYRSPVFQPLLTFFNTFYMPLFFFVSGLFHSNKCVWKRSLKFILIAFILKIFFALETLLFYGYCDFQLLEDGNMPWFLFALASFTLFSYSTARMNKRFFFLFAVALACVTGYDPAIGNYLYLSRIIVFYPFYILGEMMKPETVCSFLEKQWIRGAGWILVILCLVICIVYNKVLYPFCDLLRGNVCFDSIEAIHTNYGCLYRLSGFLVSFFMGAAVLCIVPERKIPLITEFGERTIQVYFWHFILARVFNKLGLVKFLCTTSIGRITWMLTAVAVVFLTSINLFSFPIKQINNAVDSSKTL